MSMSLRMASQKESRGRSLTSLPKGFSISRPMRLRDVLVYVRVECVCYHLILYFDHGEEFEGPALRGAGDLRNTEDDVCRKDRRGNSHPSKRLVKLKR
jgi:hypothetical protein